MCLGKNKLIIFFVLTVSLFELYAQTETYPVMHDLEINDIVFNQLVSAVEYNISLIQNGQKPEELFIIQYTVKKNDTLFTIASRCLIPYDAIVSLNGFRDTVSLTPGMLILIPSSPGIFLPHDINRNDLDILLHARLISKQAQKVTIRNQNKKIAFDFFPGERFTSTERVSFLKPDFVLPVEKAKLTSPFGMRKDPFSGELHHHNGVDLAAPEGTPVRSARTGTIKYIGFDTVLGNYIIISHDNSIETVYGHLKSIKVRLNQKVNSGTIIATVGTTGRSTGPHLHFEIRILSTAKNPALFLQGLSQ